MVKRVLKPMVRLNNEQIEEKKRFIENYKISSNPSTASTVDANANVSLKTVSTLGAELLKDFNIQINRSTMHDYISKYFSKEDADKYLEMLENHSLYKNDETCQTPATPYCVSISLYSFLESGMLKLGGESSAPKHLESYCGSFINLIFAISSQFSGAVACVEFPLYFHYFAKKDYGNDYLKTHKNMIASKLQHVIYSLNMPAAARGFQAVFFNLSFFDRYFFESMFGHFYFPDGTKIEYDEFNEFQKFFLEWLLEERKKALLTFPVLTEASLNDKETKTPKDKEWAEFIADIRSRGLSMFSYNDENVAALASCCFSGSEMMNIYDKKEKEYIDISIKDFVDMFSEKEEHEEHIEDRYMILSINNMNFTEITNITGILKKKFIGKMIEITVDGKTVKVTPDHIFYVYDIFDNTYKEIDAHNLSLNKNRYLIPVV